jgi:hypothetical protein
VPGIFISTACAKLFNAPGLEEDLSEIIKDPQKMFVIDQKMYWELLTPEEKCATQIEFA